MCKKSGIANFNVTVGAIIFGNAQYYYCLMASPAPQGVHAAMEGVDVSEMMARLRKELDAVMAFWISHSHDLKHG